ncbi:MAG: ATP-binding protein [Acidobacteriota bacterium]
MKNRGSVVSDYFNRWLEQFRSPRLQGKLLRSHLSIAAVGGGLLLISVASASYLGSTALDLATEYGPIAEASSGVLAGVRQSLGALRAWVVLGNPSFLKERERAWREEIRPKLARLQSLAAAEKGLEKEALQNLNRLLNDLEESQWWVQDIAHTPGNEPAKMLLQRDVEPVAVGIIEAVTALIEIEKAQDSSRRTKLLLEAADFRHAMTLSLRLLGEFVSNGKSVESARFRDTLGSAEKQIDSILSQSASLRGDEKEALTWARNQFRIYRDLSQEVIATREGANWNRAQSLIANKTVPLANEVTSLLGAFSFQAVSRTRAASSHIVAMNRATAGLSLGLLFTMVFVALVVANHQAEQLSSPLLTLSKATQDLVANHLDRDLPVLEEDEVGQLTRLFNSMRSSLQQSQTELREAYDKLRRHSVELSRRNDLLKQEVAVRRVTEKALQRAHDELDQRVRERTAELAQAEERYRDLFDNAPDMMAIVELKGEKILECNETMQRLLGYSRAEVIERRILDFYSPEWRKSAIELSAEFRRRGKVEGVERVLVRADGVRIPVRLEATPIKNDRGDAVAARCTWRDITEYKRAREAMQASADELRRSNSELERFAYVASHDLQEPLRKVLTFGDFLYEEYHEVLAEEGKDYLRRMRRAAGRMKDLIHDLLVLSRIQRGRRPFVRVHLKEVVGGVLDDLEIRIQKAKAQVEIGELPTLEADPTQMRQLFQNLISNALKFQPPGEAAVIRSGAERLNNAAEGNGTNGGWCQIFVEDNGIGFDSKYAERIFDPFQRLHGRGEYEGTGIGLAVCRKIVEYHGGRIQAQSSPGKGARFTITLPLCQQSKEGAEDPDTLSAVPVT